MFFLGLSGVSPLNMPVHGKIEVHADMDMMKTILRNLLKRLRSGPALDHLPAGRVLIVVMATDK